VKQFGVRLALRFAVHSGESRFAQAIKHKQPQESAIVQVARSLADSLEMDGLVASRDAYALTQGLFRCAFLGNIAVRDAPGQVAAFHVISED